MGGEHSSVRYYAYVLLGVVVLVVVDLAILAFLPGESELLPFVALVGVCGAVIVLLLAGMTTYTFVRSQLRRLSR